MSLESGKRLGAAKAVVKPLEVELKPMSISSIEKWKCKQDEWIEVNKPQDKANILIYD